MKSVTKTNAARYLDSLGIAYELRDYDLGEEEFSATAVAHAIGMPPEQVFKTLLCATHEREHIFAIVPGNVELDFKKLAHAAGNPQSRNGIDQRRSAPHGIHPRRSHRLRRPETISCLHR